MMSGIESVKKDIEDGVFKLESILVGPLMVDNDMLKPFRKISISLELCPECKQDLSSIQDEDFENKLKFNLGSMIVGEIEKEIKKQHECKAEAITKNLFE